MAMQEIKRVQIQELLKPLPPQTAATTLAVIKTLYREALAQEIVDHSPAHGIKTRAIIVQPRRFLTWEEIEGKSFGKYTTQIRFLALHGLRWSEAVALTEDDIRDGRVYIDKSVHGKPLTDKQRKYFGWVAGGKKNMGGIVGKYAMGGKVNRDWDWG